MFLIVLDTLENTLLTGLLWGAGALLMTGPDGLLGARTDELTDENAPLVTGLAREAMAWVGFGTVFGAGITLIWGAEEPGRLLCCGSDGRESDGADTAGLFIDANCAVKLGSFDLITGAAIDELVLEKTFLALPVGVPWKTLGVLCTPDLTWLK